ncbi:MAG: glucose-6-phosphate isomerase [Nitrospinota bacterium]|nr:glucose-6-phosphate isomerase [Nitrospinota bacterium]
MTNLSLEIENIKSFVSHSEILRLQGEVDKQHAALEKGEGPGSDFLGWLHLPSGMAETSLRDIEDTAAQIRKNFDTFICIGIGGSYLGARAAIDFLSPAFIGSNAAQKGPKIYFAGHNIDSDYLSGLLDLIAEKNVCLNVISKSGTTTEPALAFRLLKDELKRKFGATEVKKRIFVTTDKAKGALKSLADREGYKTFTIPDDVGGRYSVFTPVGLLPIAVAGIEVRELVAGARDMEEKTSNTLKIDENPSYLYAAIRKLLYEKGKSIEILASFDHSLAYTLEWWKQLAGESEGKNGCGIFPASVQYTTDLHSMGQWVQEGNRILFETFLVMDSPRNRVVIPRCDDDVDGLNFLAGKTLDFVNEKAYQGTAKAHLEGGVPNMTLSIKDGSPRSMGELFYFFQRAVALSGYLLGVNPFDQPGVEFYKKNMFSLLNKPATGKGK